MPNRKKAILESFSEEWKGCTPNAAGDGCVDDQTKKRNFYNKDMKRVNAIKDGTGDLDPNFLTGTFGDGSSSGSSSGSGSTNKSSASVLHGCGTFVAAAALGVAAMVVL
jgi:hypothetical protein